MAEINNQDYIGDVALDGGRFVNVDFRNGTLSYSGGQPPHIENCRFHGTTFRFDGPAGQTLNFLNMMAPSNTNMRGIVEGLLPGLKS